MTEDEAVQLFFLLGSLVLGAGVVRSVQQRRASERRLASDALDEARARATPEGPTSSSAGSGEGAADPGIELSRGPEQDADTGAVPDLDPLLPADGHVPCECGQREFRWITIDGPDHSSDHQVVSYWLLECPSCNRMLLRTVETTRYDMSGDADETSMSLESLSPSGLARLLVRLDTAYEYNKPLRGREYRGSAVWIQQHGDEELRALVAEIQQADGPPLDAVEK